MRRQDELLTLYPRGDVLTRKFLISQAENLALAFDSEELLDFLLVASLQEEAPVRHQALFTLARFLPGFMRRRYGLAKATGGIWTLYAGEPRYGQDPQPGSGDAPGDVPRYQRAAMSLAEPLARALVPLIRGSLAGSRTPAHLALARFPFDFVRKEVLASTGGREPWFQPLLTFACLGDPSTEGTTLLQSIRERGLTEPDLLLMLGALPPRRALEAIIDLAPGAGELGRINLAVALGVVGDAGLTEALDRLLRFDESWVTIYGLRALESTGNPKYLGHVRTIFERSPSRFVKSQAVWAAGGIRSDESLEFCLRALEEPHTGIHAQALESLVRLRCPIDVLRRAAGRHVRSPSMRARVNALLATSEAAADGIPPGVLDLLMSGDAVHRIEGAYCLGYMQCAESFGSLGILAFSDPSEIVRIQAAKSLSRYPARDALRVLLPMIEDPASRVASVAARVLARYEGEEARRASATLVHAISKSRHGSHRGLLYRALGTLAWRSRLPEARESLMKGLEEKNERAVGGALEGWTLSGWDSDDASVLIRKIASTGNPRITPRALLALVVGGRVEVIDELAALLRSPEEPVVNPAAVAALELGLLLAEPGMTDRFPGVKKEIDRILAGGFQENAGLGARCSSLPPVMKHEIGEAEATEDAFAGRRSADPGSSGAPPGEMPHAQGAPRPVASPGSGREGEKERVLQQLKEHLGREAARKDIGREGVSVRLLQGSYLVGESSPVSRIREAIRKDRGLLIPITALVVGLLVLLGVAWNRSVDRARAATPDLSITEIRGTVLLDAVAPDPGAGVRVGQTLKTREKSSVALSTRGGTVLSVGPRSEVTFDRIEPHPSGEETPASLGVAVTDGGAYDFVIAADEKVVVRHGPFTVSGRQATISLRQDLGRFSLIVTEGQVTLAVENSRSETVGPGDVRVLD